MRARLLGLSLALSAGFAVDAWASDWALISLDGAGRPAAILPETRPNAGAGFVDGLVDSVASGDVRRAWYVAPTRRYRHGVLGDAVEAGGLVAETAEGARLRLDLPKSEVFEDQTPRLVDLDGDGRVEIVAIVASQSAGAALAVYGAEGGRLVERARGPHIGRANRWLNVAAIADFLGAGDRQIAYVETPHIGGTLRLYRFAAGRLEAAAALYGFSTHAIGSRELRLAATADIDGDGRAELALPSADRRALRIMEIDDGAWREVARLALPARVETAIAAEGSGAETRFILGLSDGSRVAAAAR